MQINEFSFYHTTKYKLAHCLSISLFFYLFVIFFLPFGVDNYNPNHKYTFDFLLEIFYFFLVILVVLLGNEFLVRPAFIKSISLMNIVLWNIWTFILVSTIVFITYNYLGNWHDYQWSSYLGFLINVPSVIIFPTLGTLFYFRYKTLHEHIDHILTSKFGASDSKRLISFQGDGSKDKITLSLSNFIYGRSQDNYVELYYLEQQALKKFLMRASLRKLVDDIDHPAIVRCHRSFMVNLSLVKAVKGAQHEINIFLDPFDTVVPVSKSYREDVMHQLRALKNFS